MYSERIRLPALLDKVMSASDAAALIEDGMTVGMSGFTRAGEAKAVPRALAERARRQPLQISLMTGASLGNDLDKQLTEAGVLARRMPFQVDATLRKAINAGEVMFIDQHLSDTVEQIRNLQLKKPDIAVIEAVAITEDGHIVPTTSVGNSASFAIFAERVIVEINLAHNPNLEGLHDIYIPTYRPTRTPIPLVRADQRIGSGAIPIPAEKIAAIVITEQADSYSTVTAPDAETQAIADHLIAFFGREVEAGRLPQNLGPLQAGIGSIANAVMAQLLDAGFGKAPTRVREVKPEPPQFVAQKKVRRTVQVARTATAAPAPIVQLSSSDRPVARASTVAVVTPAAISAAVSKAQASAPASATSPGSGMARSAGRLRALA